MRNPETAPAATTKTNDKSLFIVFQDFNGVFLAKISNSKDRETYAYGETKDLAQKNAIANYNLKYNTQHS